MPPPQHLLASRIRGYVCRPCLLKFRKPSKPAPGLCRGLANNNRHSDPKLKPRTNGEREELGKAKRLSPFEDESSIRYFEEAPDGSRREVLRDDDEETLKETLSSFQNLQKYSGISPQTLMEALEGTTNILDPPGSLDRSAEDTFDINALEALRTQNQQLRAQIRMLESRSAINDTPAEDLLALFNPITPNSTASMQKTIDSIEDAVPSPAQRGRLVSSELVPEALLHEQKYVPLKGGSAKTQQSPIDIDIKRFPQEYQMNIQILKETLDQALSPPAVRRLGKINARQYSPTSKLWKEYLLCRPGLLSVPNEIPPIFWNNLWRAFESNEVKNLDRMVHLKCVGDDMLKAGERLEPFQRILYIEATFIHGDQVEALRDWELAGRTRWNDTDLVKEYLGLGVRMFCITKQIDRALQTAETILQTSQNLTSSRILIPIITACLSVDDGTRVGQAWDLYQRLKLNLGDTIKMEDYDVVTSLFLEANQADLALRIFTDMMLTGDLSAVQDSAHADQIAAPEMHGHTPHTREYKLNWKDSRSLVKLPPKFNNKHFFGSWTKKLIGAGELASVRKVFDLMQDRGIRPASIHMNGLIGAWFRDGTERSRVMAEGLAWKMIRARVEFVQERDHSPEKRSLLRPVYTSGKPDSRPLLLIPLATMETFTILIQQYRRRQKYELFEDLFDALKQTRIPVDTVFLNELLWIDTKGHHKGWVWKTYQSLMETKATSPDFVTYAILWQNMKKQEDPVIGKRPGSKSSNFTTCRKLFADMIERTAILRGKKRRLPQELYDLIVQCFSYSQDLPATAVALRALQRYFNVSPNIQTARSIILQLARLGLVVPEGGDRRLLSYPSARERIEEVTKVFEILKKQRIGALGEQGIIYEDLTEEEKEVEALTLLLDLLRYVYDRRKGSFDAGSFTVATRAAKEMRVPDCVSWVSDEK